MAAMSGGLAGAAGDHHEDDKIQRFRAAMRRSWDYPFNLDPRHTREKVKFVRDFRRHFQLAKADILLALDENVQGIRRKLIERKVCVQFYDAGLSDSSTTLIRPPSLGEPESEQEKEREPLRLEWGDSSVSSWDTKEDTESYLISNSLSLEDKFRIRPPRPANPADRRSRNRNGNAPPDDQPELEPLADPVCRFMYVCHVISSLDT